MNSELLMRIEEIVNRFITDLKKTPEYKQAWKTIPETKDIIFNFRSLSFYKFDDIMEEPLYVGDRYHKIVMDEEVLLSR